ncbi:MAG: hypothetical protein JRF62_17175 [Deltaproteobacteria bacterium]|nr:hypothetical protein [Deltaproteobacteria bacterium]MBW2680441.1 hypothetical protein [Deltaproteobacteria bacterium]
MMNGLGKRVKTQKPDLAGANEQLIAPKKMLMEGPNLELSLANLSTLFINVLADRIDSTIEDAQRSICEFLDIDRSTLWQVCKEEPGMLQLTHSYQPPESPPPAERMNGKDFFP